ncbi:TonB-dependent receptor [Paraferrimonas sp. SM1919]|uniref:TonB-dependent receptor n=1 Tax=Paraferrimonas sp. SM1919 TaxID=2662263 RepID=UPI0013D2C8FF|nr:TonB-dependent receptor [Paraferrimonas sp. SM1919]
MNKQNKIAQAVKYGIYASIAASAMTAAQAIAEEQVERLEITGSRIQRADMETASPVTVIGSEEIAAQGYNSVDEVLASQPAMAGMALGGTSNNGSNGKAEVNLRGLGASRTLVLVNGRRMVNSGTGADSSVDLNNIPVAMIKRIEVLKDGASAIYGSDAIAGVINIITKTDFEGFSLDVKGGATGHGDGQNKSVSALYGFNTDSGNYTFGASYNERGQVIQSDRAWTEPGNSSFIPGGTLGGKVYNPETGKWQAPDKGYDYTKTSYYQTPSKRYNLFASAAEDISDDTRFTADFMYTKRISHQQLAPEPAKVMLNVCQEGSGTPGVDCIEMTPDMVAGGITPDKFGRLEYRRRMTDLGPRIYEQDVDTFRLSAGFDGYIDAHEGLNWDVSYTLGYNEAKSYVHNSIDGTAMKQSMYQNPNEWVGGGPLSQNTLNKIGFTQQNSGGNRQHTLQANISGDLFEMDGGMAAFASGFEYRGESGYFTPDAKVISGDATSGQQDPTKGDYQVASVYTEMALPFTDALTGEFAVRYDNYSTFGGKATYKAGLTYELSDSIMLRTVAATGFRAPNINELFGGSSYSFDYLTDPWGNEKDPQIKVKYISDPNLRPEESKSFTAGMVISPQSVDGLSFTIDYFDYDIKNAIVRLDAQAGLNQCHADQANGLDASQSEACKVFGIGNGGDLTNFRNPLTNVGQFRTTGIDFNTQYSFEALGLDWNLNNDLTRLLKFDRDGRSLAGVVDQNVGAYAKWKNMFRLSARSGDWSAMYTNRYIGDMLDQGASYSPLYGKMVGDIMYHNISANYHVSDTMTISFGIKNLTDEKPRFISNGSDGGTTPEVYDVLGRRFYGGINVRF